LAGYTRPTETKNLRTLPPDAWLRNTAKILDAFNFAAFRGFIRMFPAWRREYFLNVLGEDLEYARGIQAVERGILFMHTEDS
jgi:hypothetical protein